MAEDFETVVYRFTNELAELLIRKRKDYGPGNLAEFGDFGVLVRVSDKFHRLKTLLGSGAEPANESIEDTWQDVAGYSILALMIRAYGMAGYVALENKPTPKLKYKREPEPEPMAYPAEDYATAAPR